MKKIFVMLTIALMISSVFALAAGNQPEKLRVFLEFRGAPDTSVVQMAGGHVLYDYQFLDNVLAIEVPVNALPGLLRNPNVVSYEFDAEVHAFGNGSKRPPGDGGNPPQPAPAQVLPWGIDRIDADLAVGNGTGTAVCVVDTGIDRDHPDLQTNIIGGQNFVAKGRSVDVNKWDDDNGHGTHVAGTIAALDNEEGVVGVAPETSLLIAKVLNRQGNGYLSDVIAGVEFCVANGADVVSMSLGASVDVQAVHDAMDVAFANGVLLVAAAGNGYGGPVSFPAAYDSVIAVSSTDADDSLSSFSNVGQEVELAAPGRNIFSTWNDGSYNTISGTSMATPHVSGVAALAVEANPLLSNIEIRNLLQSTADDLGSLGKDDFFGFGLVDAELIN